MSNKITVSIDGPGVSPATVSLSDLFEVLGAFQAALNITAGGITSISLVDIVDGSDTLILDVDHKTKLAADTVIDAIESEDDSKLKPGARAHIRKIWKRTQTRQWDFVSLSAQNGASTNKVAKITPSHEPFSVPVSSGSTSLMAYVTHIGGEPRATVKFNLSDRKGFTAEVKSTSLAEEIPLYKYVQLQGKATWDTRNWSLLNFVVHGLGPYEHTGADPRGALDRLSGLSGGSWDAVDPTAYFNDLRSD
ncbi:MAG: hypothetical protein IID44_11965 [Planctomycetes bacterium]|nr:hypothetical protein [Planctomycetota bacterium]